LSTEADFGSNRTNKKPAFCTKTQTQFFANPPQLADYLSERKRFLTQVLKEKEANILPWTLLSLQSFGSSVKSVKQIAALSHLISRFIFRSLPRFMPFTGQNTKLAFTK
jgi:hypothetical protein